MYKGVSLIHFIETTNRSFLPISLVYLPRIPEVRTIASPINNLEFFRLVSHASLTLAPCRPVCGRTSKSIRKNFGFSYLGTLDPEATYLPPPNVPSCFKALLYSCLTTPP